MPARTVAVTTCKGHERFDGATSEFDIGACLLAEAVTDVPLIPILAPCEAAVLAPGTPTTLVGFGTIAVHADETLGIKRIVQTTIGASLTPNTLRVGSKTSTGCHGDSGSPAFVRVPDGSQRVFGILSANYDLECESPGVYVKLAAFVPWLESSFGLDVSPCLGDDGVWQKSSNCGSFPSAPEKSGPSWLEGCSVTELATALDSCELPDAGLADADTPPPVEDSGVSSPEPALDAADSCARPPDDAAPTPVPEHDAAPSTSGACALVSGRHVQGGPIAALSWTALLLASVALRRKFGLRRSRCARASHRA